MFTTVGAHSERTSQRYPSGAIRLQPHSNYCPEACLRGSGEYRWAQKSANERGEPLLDHVFITVKDLDRSIAFYETALKALGIVHAVDYDGKDGPEGHPDLKGFGRDGRVFFWLRQGAADAKAAHVGFVAKSKAEVNAFYDAAMAAGAADNGKPGARLYYDPRYYAANVFDPDGYSLEAVYKSWQHPRA